MGADIFYLNSFIQNMSGGVLAEGGGGGLTACNHYTGNVLITVLMSEKRSTSTRYKALK